MVNLPCRNCGSEVASDDKSRKCRQCGELFPFACAVCEKHLRPPIPDFPIERYFNEEGEPLCADHYQRQCPECSSWFRADENPGFFLCPPCTERRDNEVRAGGGVQTGVEKDSDEEFEDDNHAPQRGASKQKSGCGAGVLLWFALGASVCVAPALWAFWQ